MRQTSDIVSVPSQLIFQRSDRKPRVYVIKSVLIKVTETDFNRSDVRVGTPVYIT